MTPIPAVYEQGVFRPTVPVQLPEGAQVNVVAAESVPKVASPPELSEEMKEIYDILGERYSSGHTDTAARHNEHQP
jgi:predicted DNA-binding antitoxin AbrB/MazE fold protein